MTRVVLVSNWILMLVISSSINCQRILVLLESMKILLVVLLWQFAVNGQQNSCNNESTIQIDLREGPPTDDTYEVFVRYCTVGSWHYLCEGGTGWTPTLATVACRQQGYSDQGAMLGLVGTCNDEEKAQLNIFFRLTQACAGNETSLELCPGKATIVTGCACSQVASITCQARGGEDGDTYTTTTHYQHSTEVTSPQSENITVTVTSTTSQEGTTTLQVQDNTTIIAALAAVISFLLVVVTVTLIIVCIAVFRKKTLAINQQSNQGPSTKKNESYSLRQLDDPVYDEASSTQPNYSSLGPTYDMEAENDEVTNSYDYIQQPQDTNNTPQFKAANRTPVSMEGSENDFYDAEEHTYAVVNANKKKKSKKKITNSAADNEEHTADVQETPPNPTPVRDDASKNGDDFYDAEEHTYSAVNIKQKKRGNKKAAGSGEGGREEDN